MEKRMKILVVGGGGREHALVWKIAQSPLVKKIYCAPGNPGISELAECVNIPAEEIKGLCEFAKKQKIDLTVVGPEDPLVLGIVDVFTKAGLRIFGPTARAAEIEGSKVFAKTLMRKYGIPAAEFRTFEVSSEQEEEEKEVKKEKAKQPPQDVIDYIKSLEPPVVVKADGLAKGKGAIVCPSLHEAIDAVDRIMVKKEFGESGNRIVVEEFLTGEEVSVLALTDGKTIMPLEPAQDHKPIYDGDKGPNTGGMGAYSPVPIVTPELAKRIDREILVPTVHAMNRQNRPYRGVLYAGLMLTPSGPKVLEYNARFGDPETQPILVRMKSDLVPLLLGVTEEKLEEMNIEWDPRPAVCVVMASAGYPGKYEKGKEITGTDTLKGVRDVFVFHAGTALKDGKVVTNGGRVLGVTALGEDIGWARVAAYEAVKKIKFQGVQFRTDIGAKALKHEVSG
jgi:phosphoribosylamine--glycine ligase